MVDLLFGADTTKNATSIRDEVMNILRQWRVFVSNRIAEIQRLCDQSN